MKLVRKIYEWTLEKSKHPKATWFLALVAFCESSFFPIPPDIILIPMILANKFKAWLFAFICTISSVAGGLLGYCIGFLFYSTIGIIILQYYGLENQFNSFEKLYDQYGIWIVLGAGFTPFPFKFVTIASGVFHLNLLNFILISLIGRGVRFYIITILLKIFGNIIKKYIDKYFNILTILFFVILFGSILLLKFI